MEKSILKNRPFDLGLVASACFTFACLATPAVKTADARHILAKAELAKSAQPSEELKNSLDSNRWQPFIAVQRPPVPVAKNVHWVRNPIDAFVAVEHEK